MSTVQELEQLFMQPHVLLDHTCQFKHRISLNYFACAVHVLAEGWEWEEANLGPRFKLMPLSQASKW